MDNHTNNGNQDMPQALPFVSYHLDADRLLDRPKLAAHIALVSVHWTRLEENLADLLTSMLTQPEQVSYGLVREMFTGIISPDARRSMLEAVGRLRLPKPMYNELARLLDRVRARQIERNSFIHREWAISSEIPDGLVRIPTALETRVGKPAPKYMIYKEKNFLDTIARIKSLNDEILSFSNRCFDLRQRKRRK
jgi:hypothetical protein